MSSRDFEYAVCTDVYILYIEMVDTHTHTLYEILDFLPAAACILDLSLK